MKYALALAGGGTRGAFEVGVWQALKELGIDICAITGTSIGAVNGAVFASGSDGETLWKTIDAKDVADINGKNLFAPASIISTLKKVSDGGIDASAFGDFLAEHIDERAIRDSGIDYGLCTYRTDTKKSEELFLSDIPDGKLTDYILASACFPLFKPVTIDGVEYSDGGILNNLPENMLISKGYDSIISVSVKGPGYVKSVDKCGINIIEINCKTPEVGVMDFNTDAIGESIKSGYYECMRVFGKCRGEIYPIQSSSFSHALLCYGPKIISGLEEAARICKIDPYREYTFDELKEAVFSAYRSNSRLRLMTYAISHDLPLRGVLDSLGKIFCAANSIVYLLRHENG